MRRVIIGCVLASAALSVAALGLFGVHGRASGAAAAQAKGTQGVILQDKRFIHVDILGPVPDNPSVTLSRPGFTFTDQTNEVTKSNGVNNGVSVKARAVKGAGGAGVLTVTVTGLDPVTIPSDTQDPPAKHKFDRHGTRLKDGEQVVLYLFASSWPNVDPQLIDLVQNEFYFPDKYMIPVTKGNKKIGVKITGTATKRSKPIKPRDGDDISVQVTGFDNYDHPASTTD
jgi:hypothetical protein